MTAPFLTLDEIARAEQGYDRHDLALYRRLLATARAYHAAQEDVGDYEALGELQRRRELPWIRRWQIDTGKLDTLPDYGEIIGWITSKADAAEAEAARLLLVCSTVDEARLQLETRLKEENARLRAVVEAATVLSSTYDAAPPYELTREEEALRDAIAALRATETPP